jgi:hypothetical protein
MKTPTILLFLSLFVTPLFALGGNDLIQHPDPCAQNNNNLPPSLECDLGTITKGKAYVLQTCLTLADIGGAIQRGRKYHNHTYPQFLAHREALKTMMRQDKQGETEIKVILKIADKVFQYPMHLTEIMMWSTIYTLCVEDHKPDI